MALTRALTPIQVLDKQSSHVFQHLMTFEGTITILENANAAIDTASAALQESIDTFRARIENAELEKQRNLVVIRNLKELLGQDSDGE